MSVLPSVFPDPQKLASLFGRLEDLGQFIESSADELPPYFRQLLDHDNHMTVQLETACGCGVAVEVKRRRLTPQRYERKSLLREKRGGRVVQLGIVRLHSVYLDESVREAIEEEQIPLGRILIHHQVLRRVQCVALWRITTGPELQRAFSLPTPTVTYGRTAVIHCNDNPAVELLEIVAPQGDR